MTYPTHTKKSGLAGPLFFICKSVITFRFSWSFEFHANPFLVCLTCMSWHFVKHLQGVVVRKAEDELVVFPHQLWSVIDPVMCSTMVESLTILYVPWPERLTMRNVLKVPSLLNTFHTGRSMVWPSVFDTCTCCQIPSKDSGFTLSAMTCKPISGAARRRNNNFFMDGCFRMVRYFK